MGLPALLTVQFIPPGPRSAAWPSPCARPRGSLPPSAASTARRPILWYLTLLTGFWILYSTQLGIMDLFPRTVTDILWTSNPARPQLGEGRRPQDLLLDPRRLRRLGLHRHQPGPAVHPDHPGCLHGRAADVDLRRARLVRQPHVPAKEIQAPAWRQWTLFCSARFFGFFTLVVILSRVFGVKIG